MFKLIRLRDIFHIQTIAPVIAVSKCFISDVQSQLFIHELCISICILHITCTFKHTGGCIYICYKDKMSEKAVKLAIDFLAPI